MGTIHTRVTLFFVVLRSSVRAIFLKTDERDIHRKMYPKYGLFDFFESKSIEVAATSNIVWGDTEPPRTWPRVFCGLADLRTCGPTNGYFADLAADFGPQNTHRRSASPQNTHTSTVSVFADR